MHPRLRLVLLIATVLAAAGVLAVVIADSGDDGPGSTVAAGFRGSLRPPAVPAQDFRLRDQDGRITTLREHRGDVVVLTFLYTTCEDTCPIQADQVRVALDELGGDPPAVLAVSVDPANDTAARARTFVLEHRLTGRMRFLLGSRERLSPIWRHYGIRPQGRGFEHTAYVLLLDRDGRQRVGFPVSELTPSALAHDIEVLRGLDRSSE